MGNKKEVVLMDIKTKEQKTYESMTSVAKEFGMSTNHISDCIKKKTIFRNKYLIFLKGNPIPDTEDIIPYYLKNEKINMYTTSGKYVKTFDNLKDIRIYLADKYCKYLHNFEYSYIIEIIDKKNRRMYDYMFRSFKNNESCEDIEPYIPNICNSTGESKPVILMDIYTKDQKSYESMTSLARKFGLATATIRSYIKKNYIFRKRYYIILEDQSTPNAEEIISNYLKKHPVAPNDEDILPYYLKKEKINMYTTSGKYVKTFDNLKDINDYLFDICNYRYSYKHIIKNIDKNDGSIRGYMFRSLKNNEDCKDIEPYKIRKTKKEVILMNIYTKEQKTYDSLRSLGEEFGISGGNISVYIKNKIIFRKRYYIFLKGDPVPNIKPRQNKEVVLMDITTKNQTTYESISSLVREFGVNKNCISNHIKRKTLFREKYRIFLKEDVPNDNT